MATVTQTCTKCGKQFLVVDTEQQFLNERGLPLPVICPTDRQARRLELRGRRELFKAKCQKCGKDIVISYNPEGITVPILCKEDYERYFEENDAIINEPLPGNEGGVQQPQAAPVQPSQPSSASTGTVVVNPNQEQTQQ